MPLTMSGLAVIILVGRFWKRSNWQGALAALITTPVVSLILMCIPVIKHSLGNGAIPATLAGVLAQVVVSLLTPPPTTQLRGSGRGAEPRAGGHRGAGTA